MAQKVCRAAVLTAYARKGALEIGECVCHVSGLWFPSGRPQSRTNICLQLINAAQTEMRTGIPKVLLQPALRVALCLRRPVSCQVGLAAADRVVLLWGRRVFICANNTCVFWVCVLFGYETPAHLLAENYSCILYLPGWFELNGLHMNAREQEGAEVVK